MSFRRIAFTLSDQVYSEDRDRLSAVLKADVLKVNVLKGYSMFINKKYLLSLIGLSFLALTNSSSVFAQSLSFGSGGSSGSGSSLFSGSGMTSTVTTMTPVQSVTEMTSSQSVGVSSGLTNTQSATEVYGTSNNSLLSGSAQVDTSLTEMVYSRILAPWAQTPVNTQAEATTQSNRASVGRIASGFGQVGLLLDNSAQSGGVNPFAARQSNPKQSNIRHPASVANSGGTSGGGYGDSQTNAAGE